MRAKYKKKKGGCCREDRPGVLRLAPHAPCPPPESLVESFDSPEMRGFGVWVAARSCHGVGQPRQGGKARVETEVKGRREG
mmetsp:Transcript_12962/g.19581  ORF Transcript_12962/g.19581 Transcript_12962/m.19581 type:complete len:81 (-) Transcript_12962:68-310(-)